MCPTCATSEVEQWNKWNKWWNQWDVRIRFVEVKETTFLYVDQKWQRLEDAWTELYFKS